MTIFLTTIPSIVVTNDAILNNVELLLAILRKKGGKSRGVVNANGKILAHGKERLANRSYITSNRDSISK